MFYFLNKLLKCATIVQLAVIVTEMGLALPEPHPDQWSNAESLSKGVAEKVTDVPPLYLPSQLAAVRMEALPALDGSACTDTL